MKYTFITNQQAIADAGLLGKTDFVDWAILEYVRAWEGTKAGQKLGSKVWISYQHLIEQIPLARITDKSMLSRRMSALRKLGLIDYFYDRAVHKLFAETTVFYERILFSKEFSHQEKAGQPREEAVAVEQLLDESDLFEEAVAVEQEAVAVQQVAVATQQLIHKSVYIHQDSKHQEENIILKPPQPPKGVAGGMAANNLDLNEKALTSWQWLLDRTLPWYRQQGYRENIVDHLASFVGKLKNNELGEIKNQAGFFKFFIESDKGGVRAGWQEELPDWAKVQKHWTLGQMQRHVSSYPYPKNLRHWDVNEELAYAIREINRLWLEAWRAGQAIESVELPSPNDGGMCGQECKLSWTERFEQYEVLPEYAPSPDVLEEARKARAEIAAMTAAWRAKQKPLEAASDFDCDWTVNGVSFG
jgi:hypothetical protein